MCYILYGAVNREVNAADLERITKRSRYTFRPGTKHDLKMCISGNTYEYRVTDWVCDCDFPVGAKDPQAKELKELTKLIRAEDLPAVFVEQNGSRSAASILSRETGCAVGVLDMVMSGTDYFEAMEANIQAVKEALS